ncbi:YfiT family bacillithiol transferase [Metabacillus idriensis]|uniref:YfiT family bacillithiol transferase n=1 Tax=Metabacillus idriensis TaxID=324768 RepID=UPI00174D6520|nr:bacillithiol transferase BstA [Metabacillus idriensis]
MDDLRYPIGLFQAPEKIERHHLEVWLEELSAAPVRLRDAISGLTGSQLDTPYRPDGWTVQQVVHHIPDSHMNAYIRFKLALTEENPVIRPYDEKGWAELHDSKYGNVEVSMKLLVSLHQRFVNLAASLSESDLNRTFYHPANQTSQTLKETIGMYAWHGNHHIAHIAGLRKRNGW